jgi:hypothetical protein
VRAQAVGAAWQAVFDRAREDARGAGSRAASPRDARASDADSGERDAAVAARGGAVEVASRAVWQPLGAPRASVGIVEGDMAGVDVPPPGSEPLRAATPTTGAMLTPIALAVAIPTTSRPVATSPAPIAAPTPDFAPTPTAPPDDSVHMLVDGHAVAITVRDGTLSDGEALHAAFEAARVVAGEGRALRQLTLNGRVLYQRPEGADDPPPRAGSFAC